MKKRIDMLIYMLAFSPWTYWILAGACWRCSRETVSRVRA